MAIKIFDSISSPTSRLICEQSSCLFINYGYDGTCINAIAHASGIKKSSLYHYFRKKMDLAYYLMQKLSEYATQRYFSITEPQEIVCLYKQLHQWENTPIDRKILFLLPSRLMIKDDLTLQKHIKHFFEQWLHFFEDINSHKPSNAKELNFFQWFGEMLLQPILDPKCSASLGMMS